MYKSYIHTKHELDGVYTYNYATHQLWVAGRTKILYDIYFETVLSCRKCAALSPWRGARVRSNSRSYHIFPNKVSDQFVALPFSL
jgi:hypothetical protein